VISRLLPESGRSSNRDLRLAARDRCAAMPESQAETETSRSTFLGRSISILVTMAFGALDRQTRYGIDWHRRGFRWFWTWRIRCGEPGRPRLSKETRELIRTLSRQCRMGSAQN